MVKNQSILTENGIYKVKSGTWERVSDFEDSSVQTGSFTFVEEGNINSDSGWVPSSDNNIIVETDNIEFVQFSGAGSIIAGLNLLKNALTMKIK